MVTSKVTLKLEVESNEDGQKKLWAELGMDAVDFEDVLWLEQQLIGLNQELLAKTASKHKVDIK